jgi:hypothetical protein
MSDESASFLSFLTGFVALVAVVAIIVFGVNSCSERETEIRIACVRANGTVIPGPNGGSYCVRPPAADPAGVKP